MNSNWYFKHHRRSIRLPGYDYSQPGAYFVTICSHEREPIFGIVRDGDMYVNHTGDIARDCWMEIPGHFPSVSLDEFVVMPDHIHGIIIIRDDCRGEASAAFADASPLQWRNGTAPGSLAAIVQNYKSISARKINAARHSPGLPVWQRNYWEHIVRNEYELDRIRVYIRFNPRKWQCTSNGKD